MRLWGVRWGDETLLGDGGERKLKSKHVKNCLTDLLKLHGRVVSSLV